MATQLPPVRRVVTGHDASGVATIVEDALAKHVREVPERPGYRVSNLWTTGESPTLIAAPDRIATITGVAPPQSGTVLRIIDYPPEPKDPAERDRMFRAMFAKLFPDADHRGAARGHPGMHATETVDYAIVLAGEIWAILEDKETLLRAGDVLIQRGTNHAWANRSDDFARIAFVLIGGK